MISLDKLNEFMSDLSYCISLTTLVTADIIIYYNQFLFINIIPKIVSRFDFVTDSLHYGNLFNILLSMNINQHYSKLNNPIEKC